jgi:hypothetical protein
LHGLESIKYTVDKIQSMNIEKEEKIALKRSIKNLRKELKKGYNSFYYLLIYRFEQRLKQIG